MSKAKTTSAGLLLYRIEDGRVEVLIAHMGGPFWAQKDERSWSIPKGEYVAGEDPFQAARREFEEELGTAPPVGHALELGEVRQPSGKRIVAWAMEGNLDPDSIESNTFEMEWPPKSGRIREFPEVDRAAWVAPATAAKKLVKGQVPFLEVLRQQIGQRAERWEEEPRSAPPLGGHSPQSGAIPAVQATLF